MFSKFLSNNRSNILLLIALIVYNSLFFSERFGINILLFIVLILGFQYFLFKESFKSRNVLISAGLTLFTAAMIVWHNSLLSKWMFFISYAVTLGFILQSRIRFIGYSMLTAASNFTKIPVEFFSWNKVPGTTNHRKLRISRVLMLSGLPVIIVIIFFMIYRVSNPMFANFTDRFFEEIGAWFQNIFRHISFVRILFILSGIILLSALLFNRGYHVFAREEEQFNDKISRKRRALRWPFLRLDFRNEYLSGIILLVMMNLLLLVLNIIDIKYIWISFKIPAGVSLSEMVHHGTEWLIVSIILSMVVLIYLFRANQNFYSGNKWLKYLAYAWMLQNMVLTVSLLVRNNTYVSWHALAYKRLGVYVFIALTFIGLITMLIKIYGSKSFFYLLRVNSWAAIFMMCGVCSINWDIFIAKYNVEFSDGANLDTDFLLKLSPKSYPYILEKMDKVTKQIDAHDQSTYGKKLLYFNTEGFESELERRSLRYIAERSENTWYSYNVSDQYAIEYLKNKYTR